VGNAEGIQNSVIMDGTCGHLSYVGDSVIGEKCNFGAGTITANCAVTMQIKMMVKDKLVDTGRRKLAWCCNK
jgi:bifunctional UDP-N-acetylglucosamine pyrophosphorylase/glucosamine-1-phosphate N-acetyltransferase